MSDGEDQVWGTYFCIFSVYQHGEYGIDRSVARILVGGGGGGGKTLLF
jgi:hypothetical protein